jgi:Trm5-related predicted tRNA methylase
MTSHIHRVTKVSANSVASSHWVEFEDEAGNNRVVIFCPNAEIAQATADAWNDAIAYSGAKDVASHEPA